MIKLLTHQVRPTAELYEAMTDLGDKNGRLIIGATGCGKTFVFAAAIKQAQDTYPELFKFNDDLDSMFLQYPIMVLTPKNAIVQQQRVLLKAGIVDVIVCSADSLRTSSEGKKNKKGEARGASFGDQFIYWKSEMVKGVLEIVPYWHESTMPRIIMLDECQNCKNPDSLKTKVLLAYVKAGGKLILISATPFQKGCEARLIVAACGLTSVDSSGYYIKQVTQYQDEENSPTAVKRIKEALKARGKLIEIKNVRYPFKPIMKNWLITPTDEQRDGVNAAYKRYCEAREEAGKHQHQNIIAVWQAQRVMRLECELLKAENIIDHAIEHRLNGKAIILASNYVPTLNKYWGLLTKKGIPASKISVLFGDMPDVKKQQAIDDFQSGRTEFFLTTLKSGGTGLSLHHCETTALPRVVILPPTWSVFELLQVLGRAQRITNLSQVIQIIAWFKGTVEEKVADRLETKYDCVKELINNSEDFIVNIFNNEVTNKAELLMMQNAPDEPNSPEVDIEEESSFDLSMLGEEVEE